MPTSSQTTRQRGRLRAAVSPVNLPQASAGSQMIEFRDVSKHYGPTDVGLDQATFGVTRGDFVFLVGATGSGKSTVMRLLIKELEPSAGTIRVAGHELGEFPRQRIPFYRP